MGWKSAPNRPDNNSILCVFRVYDTRLYVAGNARILWLKEACRLTQRAPDGWDSTRFLGLVPSYSSFPFPDPFLPSLR